MDEGHIKNCIEKQEYSQKIEKLVMELTKSQPSNIVNANSCQES